MAEQAQSMWPDFPATVRSPISMLREQATFLRGATSGLLEANVKVATTKDAELLYSFVITAVALNGYTLELFRAWHNKQDMYPTIMEFGPWRKEARDRDRRAKEEAAQMGFSPLAIPVVYDLESYSARKWANDPTEFGEFLKDIITSSHTKAVIVSLIARINDANSSIADRSEERR